MRAKRPRSQSRPGVPAWLPTTALLLVLSLALWAYVGEGRSDPASSQITAKRKQQHASAEDARRENPGLRVVKRYHYAVTHTQRLKEIGRNEMFPLTSCPDDFSLGYRRTPGQRVPEFAGNTCEPWLARYAVVFLDRLLDSDMVGFEWSTGSGTMWLLSRLRSLVSVEHHASWANRVKDSLERILPAKYFKAWDLHIVQAADGKTRKAVEEDYDNFRNYVDSTYLLSNATFDFVSVDGRARVACMSRALQILKPVGGVLLMDNSDREYYKAGYDLVPSHWLKFEDTVNTGERSTLWVSCLRGHCGRSVTPHASP